VPEARDVAVMLPYAARARIVEARGRVERAVRTLLHGDTPSWRRLPNAVPWFDAPDALQQVPRRAANAAEVAWFTAGCATATSSRPASSTSPTSTR
jgi:hypothetical protein